jgi:hypothetical protein
MKKPINRRHPIHEELSPQEIAMINGAIATRKSHIRSVDELAHLDSGPRQRKSCPTPKKRKFKDKKQADRVLHLIKNDRRAALAEGKQYRFNLTRSYMCSCGYAHHTSQDRLASFEVTDVA